MNKRTVTAADSVNAHNHKLVPGQATNASGGLRLVMGHKIRVPLFTSKIRAGFENPASDHVEEEIDPTEYLIDNPNATMLLRVEGDSMIEAEIFNGDIIVVDRKLTAHVGDVIVAETQDGFTVKYLGKHCLKPGNPKYPVMYFKDMQEIRLIGVVIAKMKRLKP